MLADCEMRLGKAYEVLQGVVYEGIPIEEDGTIHVGSVRVPLPLGSSVSNGRLMEVTIFGHYPAAMVLVRDHSGFLGGWKLTAARSDDEWAAIARRARAHRPPDGKGPLAEGHEERLWGPTFCPACDAVAPAPPPRFPPEEISPEAIRIIAEGYCAQGEVGRIGGGPEYLIILSAGTSVEVVRWSGLYIPLSIFRVVAIAAADGSVTVTITDPFAEALSQLSAAR